MDRTGSSSRDGEHDLRSQPSVFRRAVVVSRRWIEDRGCFGKSVECVALGDIDETWTVEIRSGRRGKQDDEMA